MDMYEDIEERCKEGLKYANAFVRDLCEGYGLEPIRVYAKNFSIENFDRPAKFCYVINGQSYIAYNFLRLICSKNIIEQKLRHEFRHYWQSIYYSKLFLWWMVEHQALYKSFQNAKDKYGNVLAYIYCPIEIDAHAFENGNEGNEEVLKNANLSVRHWEKLLNDNAVKDGY